ncbi:MAG: sigma-54 dependent transcriptional regulator [Longimicrobiaceae bacterium]
MARILVVDDEQGIRHVLAQLLEYEDHEVRAASSAGEALSLYPEFQPDLTFMDVKMARMDGLEALTRIRELDPAALVVMISGHGTIETAVEATRRGAYDFLEKPLDTDRILLVLRNALHQRGLLAENVRLRGEVEGRHQIVGKSFAVRQLLERVERVAPTDARVLITGENGTGKELVARAVHRLSPRANNPFIEVNCAAIPSELIESELFGHMKGSFTGAYEDRAGKFELANEGTLFLDEIGDMSHAAQAKVLRALQEGLITRVGGAKPIKVDVRVLAATNKDLEEEIRQGRFREDLYYRLNVIPLHVPPLRERREDIPMLVRHFAQQFARRMKRTIETIPVDAMQALTRYDWPGNIRELQNLIERAVILSPGPTLFVPMEALTPRGTGILGLATPLVDGQAPETLIETDRRHILAALQASDWVLSGPAGAAARLGLKRSTLQFRMRKLGIERPGTRLS